MNKEYKMLIINPGSTSTKIAIYENTYLLFEKKISHKVEELKSYENIVDQLEFRKDLIIKALDESGIAVHELDAVIGRGGLMMPVKSGVYKVSPYMLTILESAEYGEHASNLGAFLAYEIANGIDKPSYIADPVVVDELQDIARLSGIPQIERKSIFHALNHKAVGRRAANAVGKPYEDCNFIIAHLGGGISVAAHRKGECIDVNNALGGEGPYSPERAGGLPVFSIIDMCFSGEYTCSQIKKLLVGQGGLSAYLGTNDGMEISKMIESGDKKAEQVFFGMGYQVAKEIGAISAVLHGEVDAVCLTGGLAHNKDLVEYIEKMVKHLGTVMVFPGEDEMLALAESGLRVLSNKEEAKIIQGGQFLWISTV
ncbi:butyrate kinase [Anaeropeptidivorans aminofermentans]|nr:butyrate kinase [Anaeropeptidivorans aminofermentans]